MSERTFAASVCGEPWPLPALAAGLVACVLAAGCATPTGGKRISPQDANRRRQEE